MGKLQRQLERAQMKLAYRDLSRTWDVQKTAQAKVIAEQGKLPDGVRRLGRKPTLAMFTKLATRTPTAELKQVPAPAESATASAQNEEIDTEWKET